MQIFLFLNVFSISLCKISQHITSAMTFKEVYYKEKKQVILMTGFGIFAIAEIIYSICLALFSDCDSWFTVTILLGGMALLASCIANIVNIKRKYEGKKPI